MRLNILTLSESKDQPHTETLLWQQRKHIFSDKKQPTIIPMKPAIEY